MLKKSLFLIITVCALFIFVSCPQEPMGPGKVFTIDLSVKRGDFIKDVKGYIDDLTVLDLEYQPIANSRWKGRVPSSNGNWYSAKIEKLSDNRYSFTTGELNSEVDWTIKVILRTKDGNRKVVFDGESDPKNPGLIVLNKHEETSGLGTINLRVFLNPGPNVQTEDVTNGNFIINNIYYRYEGDELSSKKPLETLGSSRVDPIWKNVKFSQSYNENSNYGYAWGYCNYNLDALRGYEFLSLTDNEDYFYNGNNRADVSDNGLEDIATYITIRNLSYGYHFFYFSGVTKVDTDNDGKDDARFIYWEPIMVYLDKGKSNVTVDAFLVEDSIVSRDYFAPRETVSPEIKDVNIESIDKLIMDVEPGDIDAEIKISEMPKMLRLNVFDADSYSWKLYKNGSEEDKSVNQKYLNLESKSNGISKDTIEAGDRLEVTATKYGKTATSVIRFIN